MPAPAATPRMRPGRHRDRALLAASLLLTACGQEPAPAATPAADAVARICAGTRCWIAAITGANQT